MVDQDKALQLAEQLKTQVSYDAEGLEPFQKGEDVRTYLERVVNLKVSGNADHLINKLLELADGVFLVDRFIEGKELVYYKDKPDLKALMYLFDRVMGKPKETVAHESGKKQGLVTMEHLGIPIQVSSAERAILEVISLVPQKFDYNHAFELVENLQLLRPDKMQLLLEKCLSIKAKALSTSTLFVCWSI